MRTVLVALVVTAAACGRSGYDARERDVPDDDTRPSAAAFAFAQSPCRAANSGPFVETARYTTAGAAYGLWFANRDTLVVASTTDGLRTLRIAADALAPLGHLEASATGWAEAVWTDGPNFYLGAPGRGVSVVAIADDGALRLSSQSTVVPQARRIMGDGGYLFVPNGSDGIQAMRLGTEGLTSVGAAYDPGTFTTGVWARDGRLVIAADTRIVLATFDGSVFSIADTLENVVGANRVWVTGDTAFVSAGDGVVALRVGASSLSFIARSELPTRGRDVWSDGVHVFVADELSGLYALAFDGAQFTELDHIVADTGAHAIGVIGDGTHIYLSYGDVIAYRGFECTTY